MARKKFNAIEHIAQFNKLKLELKENVITESEFKQELKAKGIPMNRFFIEELVNSSIISKENGEIRFISSSPIHFKLLDTIYNNYYNKISKYNKNSYKDRVEKIKQQQIDIAIRFLKENGYEIFLPVGDNYVKK